MARILKVANKKDFLQFIEKIQEGKRHNKAMLKQKKFILFVFL